MAEITSESHERFNKRFPDPMTYIDIADELDRMNPQEAEEYDTILCSDLFHAWCSDYIQFTKKTIKTITGSEEFEIFKKRVSNLEIHAYYDAWIAFLEDRKRDVEPNLHAYFQDHVDSNISCGEYSISLLLLTFKNA